MVKEMIALNMTLVGLLGSKPQLKQKTEHLALLTSDPEIQGFKPR